MPRLCAGLAPLLPLHTLQWSWSSMGEGGRRATRGSHGAWGQWDSCLYFSVAVLGGTCVNKPIVVLS